MASCKFNKASLISLIIATALLAGCGGGGSGGTVQGLSAPSIVKDCPERAYAAATAFLKESIKGFLFYPLAQDQRLKSLLAQKDKLHKDIVSTKKMLSTIRKLQKTKAELASKEASNTEAQEELRQLNAELEKAEATYNLSMKDLKVKQTNLAKETQRLHQLQNKIAAEKKLLADIKANTINFSNLDVDDKCFASLNLDYTKVHAINFSNSKITKATIKHILKQLTSLEKKNISLKRLDLTNTAISTNDIEFNLLKESLQNNYSICLSQDSNC